MTDPWLTDTPITTAVITPLGGFAIGMINKTGAASIKGSVVRVYDTTAIDNAVSLMTIGTADPMGVIYEDGVNDGGMVRVIVAGIAQVLLVGAATRGHLVRTFLAADANKEVGKAMSEAFPSSPFATDKHFLEIGHTLESTSGAGLCRCVLHFN